MRNVFAATCFATAALALCSTAHAGTVTLYTDPTAYATAGGAPIAYSFPPESVDNTVLGATPYVVGNMVFTSDNSNIIFADGDYGPQEYLGTFYETASVDPVTGNLGDSIAFYLGSWNSPQTVQISVNGATAFNFYLPMAPNDTFLGITSSTPITDVTFDYSNPSEIDFATQQNTVAVTPEPSSLILLGTGTLTMAGAIRRRTQK